MVILGRDGAEQALGGGGMGSGHYRDTEATIEVKQGEGNASKDGKEGTSAKGEEREGGEGYLRVLHVQEAKQP